jgi:hypothetical protein
MVEAQLPRRREELAGSRHREEDARIVPIHVMSQSM